MAKRKALKKQTLEEFKAWIAGIELFQAAGWTPSKEQWANIRKQIDLIVEPEPVVAPPPPYNPMFPNQPGNVVPQPFIPQDSTLVDNPGMMAPQVPSSIPMPPADIAMSEAAKELLKGTGKTPNTESGSASSFA